jgi:hypothetical protein
MIQFANFWNKTYINIAAPLLQVFKLHKDNTRVDTLYGEESSSRIYMPPIEIRGFHFDNAWAQLLGPFGTTEQEENIVFVFNFDDMVQRIRARKDIHITDMLISYTGSGVPSVAKTSTNFILKVNGTTVVNFSVNDPLRNTTKKLGESIHALDDFNVSLIGRNDASTNLVNFSETYFQGSALNVYTLDQSFYQASDIIEAGDAILTNKWRLYEVMNANPSGNFGWDWITYSVSCKLARLDQVSLPGEYENEIARHQYGIKDRIEVE